jgi:hypothetical protein
MNLDPMTRVDVVTEHGFSSTPVQFMTRQQVSGFTVVGDSALIFEGERRRAVIVTFADGRPSQVFRLPVSSTPKPADWTTWQMPDYVETIDAKLDARLTFMYGRPSARRSTELPRDCFQLRYRITKREPMGATG